MLFGNTQTETMTNRSLGGGFAAMHAIFIILMSSMTPPVLAISMIFLGEDLRYRIGAID